MFKELKRKYDNNISPNTEYTNEETEIKKKKKKKRVTLELGSGIT